MANITKLPDGSFEAVVMNGLVSPITGIVYEKESFKKAIETLKLRLPAVGEFDLPDERKGQSFETAISINLSHASHHIKDIIFDDEKETVKLVGVTIPSERGQWLKDVIDGKREAKGYGFGLRGLGNRDSESFKIVDIVSFDFVKQY